MVSKIYHRQCKGTCGIISSQQKDVADALVDGEIVSCPVWKCINCGHEEKRTVRKSAKTKQVESFLQSKLEQMRTAQAAE